jgi:MFS family permease
LWGCPPEIPAIYVSETDSNLLLLRFIVASRRLLAFGFLLALLSSFGQTFFVSLFNEHIRSDFDLSHGEIGALYSAATLASGILLIWLGSRIDDVGLRLYTAGAFGLLIAACLMLAGAPHVAALGLAFFGLRFAGQGLLSHASAVTMARAFTADRGKASGFAVLGHSTGELLLPLLAVAAGAWLAWRAEWVLFAAIVTVGGVLTVLLVPATSAARRPVSSAGRAAFWRVWGILGQRSFITRLPAVLTPSFVVTGLFFHQVQLASEKGWTIEWIAACFAGYAVAKFAASPIYGLLIDRFSAIRIFPAFLVPLMMGLVVLLLSDHRAAALVYLAFTGVASGGTDTLATSLWAELYGTERLGAIRAFVVALSVLASGLAPVSLGWLIDLGCSMQVIVFLCLALVVAALLSAVAARPGRTGPGPAPGPGSESGQPAL